jgi:F0F1-type ATP synthase assembly protein I
MEMNIAMAGGVMAGYFLDKTFNTFPWLTGIFFVGGVGAGINIAVFIVKKYRKLFK